MKALGYNVDVFASFIKTYTEVVVHNSKFLYIYL